MILLTRERQLRVLSAARSCARVIDNYGGVHGNFSRWRQSKATCLGLCCCYCLFSNFVTMASDKMKCVFCKEVNDKIIPFVVDNLKKCQEVLSVRVKYKLKYSNTELPTQINNSDGYHRQCYSSFTALMAKYRNLLSEKDYTNTSSPPTLLSNISVDINKTIPRSVTSNSNDEITSEDASSSSLSQITPEDAAPSSNSEIISEDGAPSSNTQTISEHPDPSSNREMKSEAAAPSLGGQFTLGDVTATSTCDLNINETNFDNEISDTNIGDIETRPELKNVCFYCGKDR